MNNAVGKYQQVPVFRLSLSVILLLSILLPILTSLLNETYRQPGASNPVLHYFLNMGVTLLFLASEWLVIVLLMKLAQLGGLPLQPTGLRMFVELAAISILTFWMLYGYYLLLVRPSEAGLSRLGEDVNFREFMGSNLMGMLFLYLFIFSLQLHQVAVFKDHETSERKKQYLEAKLQALRNQVSPHFLFNSLSVLSSLVHISAEKSEKFIIQLSRTYRYLLDNQEKMLVSLDQELRFLESYYYLLNIRFENKIKLLIDIPEKLQNLRIPPLTLQLLVENAVKHNKMSDLEPLEISLYVNNDYLIVSNTLNIRQQAETSTGVGLENIRKRYRLFTRKEVLVVSGSRYFEVFLPLIKYKNHESSDH